MSSRKERRFMSSPISRSHQHHVEAVGAPALDESVPAPSIRGGGASESTSRANEVYAGRKYVTEHNLFFPAAIIWIGLLHIGALFAPWTFSWSGLGLVLFLHWVCGGLGICLGFHRLLTHTSFTTYRPVRFILAVFGSLAGEGSPSSWVSNHRLHHALSDQEGDPHTPKDGSWWSHVFWLAYRADNGDEKGHLKHWVPDLAKDPWLKKLDTAFLPLNIGFAAALMAIGYAIDGWNLALSWLVWGTCVRLVFVLHSTWLVNSASHIWGYKNYEIRDDSRNNWWVALLTYGEGWHNNHHAYPRMAKHGHRWWEIDITFMTIRLMQALGLAWNVVDYRNASEKRASA
jgi:stearoyl-CoA desaturase (delta-9 desaturase)